LAFGRGGREEQNLNMKIRLLLYLAIWIVDLIFIRRQHASEYKSFHQKLCENANRAKNNEHNYETSKNNCDERKASCVIKDSDKKSLNNTGKCFFILGNHVRGARTIAISQTNSSVLAKGQLYPSNITNGLKISIGKSYRGKVSVTPTQLSLYCSSRLGAPWCKHINQHFVSKIF
jgi:hypothetical protein